MNAPSQPTTVNGSSAPGQIDSEASWRDAANKSELEAARRRSKKRKLRFAILGGLILIGVVVPLLWHFVAPALLESQLRSSLVGFGFEQAELRVERLGTSEIVLGDVALHAWGKLRAERVSAEFELGQILRGRVGTIVIDAPVWEPYELLRELELAKDGGEPSPESPSPDDRGNKNKKREQNLLPQLLFDRVEIRGGRIVLEGAGEADGEEILFDGVCDATAARWRGRLKTRAGDQILECEFELTDEGEQCRGNAALRCGEQNAPLALAGPIELQMEAGMRRLLAELESTGDFRAMWRGRAIEASGTRVALALDANLSAGGSDQRASTIALDVEVSEENEITLKGEALSPGLRGTTARGTLALQARMPRGGEERSGGTLELRDVSLRGESWELDGLAGKIAVHDLQRWDAEGLQELRWSELRAGRVEGGAGKLSFALRPGAVVQVDAARWQIGAGYLVASAFELDPRDLIIETSVEITQVALAPWLELVTGGRATGTGDLSGSLALKASFAPFDFEFAKGKCIANAPGVLRLADRPEVDRVLNEHIGARVSSEESGRYDQIVRERVVQSLKDFAYRDLELDFVPIEDDVSLRIHVVGKGRKVPQELDLHLNLNGVNALLDVALGMRGALELQTGTVTTGG